MVLPLVLQKSVTRGAFLELQQVASLLQQFRGGSG
jgi:hypothetical protein